ncbi:MAG TPA: pyridoxamine 5'-phosphate oxidase family protein [Candidatus Saccharimonadales bacterium]|nr:pyridoxamine 5'-phosphate oxidase family protein [Candidatus Saccharimonadales bacterium]
MNQKVLDYLKNQRICVLAVEMLDGSPHAATVHFANEEGPFNFYFETDRDSRKSEPLFAKEITKGSLVIGSDEKNAQTFQADGIVRLLKPDEKEIFNFVYLGKFPEKKEKSLNPNFVCFTFTPTWWRFTDWTNPKEKIVINSKV